MFKSKIRKGDNKMIEQDSEMTSVVAKVTSIEWERVLLNIEIQIDGISEDEIEDLEFYLVNGLYSARAQFKKTGRNHMIYQLQTNITNNGENRCLPQGTYKIAVCQGAELLTYAGVIEGLENEAEEKAYNFLYGGRSRAYTVTFFVEENENTGEKNLVIYAMPSLRTGVGFPNYGGFGKIFADVPKQLFEYFKNTRRWLSKMYTLDCWLSPKPAKGKPTVLFMSEQNDKLGGNLQAVLDQMKKRGMDKDYNIITSARKSSSERCSYASWLELIKKVSKSDIIFLDDHAPVFDWLQLREQTKVIQLWHAGAGFKSSGYSRWGHKGCPSPTSCHRQYSYGIAGSKNIAHFFSEVWGINDEQVLPTGMPRMDEFLDENYRISKTKELYEKYPLCQGKKVILFAPTYRGRDRSTAYYPYEKIDFKELYRACGDDYVVLFKMHPWVSAPVPIDEKYRDKFIDVGTYPNINDLFYITELLITDYSSNIFEYSIMRKPMLFFAYDKVEYSFSRGFHRAYEESAPGKVCYEFDELIKAIETKDFEYEKVEEYVEHHFDYIDTHASDRVIDWFVLGNIPEDLVQKMDAVNERNVFMEQLDFTPEEVEEEDEEYKGI